MLLRVAVKISIIIVLGSFIPLIVLLISTVVCTVLMQLDNVLDKPTVSVVTPDPVLEGQSVTITCWSQGTRPAVTSVTWKKGQEVISVTTDSKYTGGTVRRPSLTIGSVLKADAGEYTCQLDNDMGHGTGSVTLEVGCK